MADETPTCFVIMPITTPPALLPTYGGDANHFRNVLENLFVPAIEAAGFKAERPIAEGAEIIHAEIIRKLDESELVLCDMSAMNANVFFELGIRTAMDKSVCIVRDQHVVQPPFDTSLINHHVYDASPIWNVPNEVERLTAHIRKSHEGRDGRNPLWTYFGMVQPARFQAPEPWDKLDEAIKLLKEIASPNPLVRRRDPTSFIKAVQALSKEPFEARDHGGAVLLIFDRKIGNELRAAITAAARRYNIRFSMLEGD